LRRQKWLFRRITGSHNAGGGTAEPHSDATKAAGSELNHPLKKD